MPGDKNISGNEFPTPASERVQILSAQPFTGWDLNEVFPEAYPYIAEEDNLVVTGLFTFGVVLTVSGRILDALSKKVVPFQQTITVAASAAIQQFQIGTAEGFLLGATIAGAAAGNGTRQNYVALGIMRGALSLLATQTQLCAGYLNNMGLVSWPVTGIVNPREGNGVPRNNSVGNPGAGAEWTYTVAGALREQLVSIHATLATAVAVANRQVTLVVDDGANTLWESTPGPVQAASLTWDYTGAGFGYAPTNVLTKVSVHVDPSIVMQAGFRVRTVTTNIQGADQWSNIRLLTRQWIDIG